MRATPAERLNRGLERKPNGCLEWTGATHRQGYGQIGVDGKTWLTHRFAWTVNKGPIPPGIKVLHRCDNPPCCDTDKCLFLGTQGDNVIDMAAKGRHGMSLKTHCPQKHLYDEANTRVNPNGSRECRLCNRDKARRRRE